MKLYVIVRKARTVSENAAKVKTFVSLQVQDENVKTHIVGGKDPVWHQTFSFEITDISDILVVKLMQCGLIFDSVLGFLNVPLAEVHYATKAGEGKWHELLVEQDGSFVNSGNEILLDVRFDLPSDLSVAEQEELARRLSTFNEILDNEVETIKKQHKRIQNEGFKASTQSLYKKEATSGDDESSITGSKLTIYSSVNGDDFTPLISRDQSLSDEGSQQNGETPTKRVIPRITFSEAASLVIEQNYEKEEAKRESEERNDNVDGEVDASSQNSDPEADKDLKQDGIQVGNSEVQPQQQSYPVIRRKHHASITAKRNWRKALDDIKAARQSGVYDLVKNESEEFSARERVKSILQSNSPPADRKMRPKSTGDALYETTEVDENTEQDDIFKKTSTSMAPLSEEPVKEDMFRRRNGFKAATKRLANRRQSTSKVW